MMARFSSLLTRNKRSRVGDTFLQNILDPHMNIQLMKETDR